MACVDAPSCVPSTYALVCRVSALYGGRSLPYHSFWPPVTETIWSRCQNPIRKRGQKQRQSRERRYLSGRMKCWERSQRSAVEAKKKKNWSEKKGVWNVTLHWLSCYETGQFGRFLTCSWENTLLLPTSLTFSPSREHTLSFCQCHPACPRFPLLSHIKKGFVSSAFYRTLHSVYQHNLLTLWSQTTTDK